MTKHGMSDLKFPKQDFAVYTAGLIDNHSVAASGVFFEH